MAKWLNKYFSLGNNKTKSPPQPPRPDYREKRNGAGGAPRPDGPPHLHHRHHHTSPGFQHRHLCDDTSDLLRAYRAQKDLDFEDPYSGPGSSLRKLRAMCRPDYYAPEDAGEVAPRAFSTSSCCAAPPAAPAAGSPHLFRSHSERRPATPPDVKYISPKHRLIKVESSGSAAADSAGTMLSKGCEQLATPVPCATKEKIWATINPACLLLCDSPDLISICSPPSKTAQVLIPDDYSDPFDAKSELNKMGKGENTGYMEPYEAQRIMTAQFNGGEKRQASPSPSNDRRRQLRAPGGSFKPVKHGSPEFCGILGERIDPTIPLERQIWYHGAISRTDAENLLRLCKECSYLVRNSQTSKHDYSLSLKSSQGFMHMKLMKTKEKYILGQNSPPFDTVPEVIHYYTTRKLPIKGAEHLSLLYPVAVRTL
ncbi:SH2 domain-containing adapter protein B isoform X5 [Struthio camelus]|uniref:SH2 domain-containing adapter protein B isoform X5 n=1 Tax=Struthio camelus TaxID=8801 RepID=UPI003603B25D